MEAPPALTTSAAPEHMEGGCLGYEDREAMLETLAEAQEELAGYVGAVL